MNSGRRGSWKCISALVVMFSSWVLVLAGPSEGDSTGLSSHQERASYSFSFRMKSVIFTSEYIWLGINVLSASNVCPQVEVFHVSSLTLNMASVVGGSTMG